MIQKRCRLLLTKFELVINLRTASCIGIVIPKRCSLGRTI